MRAAGWIAAAVLVVVAACVVGRAGGEPATGDEAAFLLAAESLARDGDLALTAEDEGRVRQRGWSESVRPRMLLVDEQQLRFAEPWIYPLVLAPFAVAFERVGVTALNAVLLMVLIVVATVSTGRRSGEDGSWTVVALVFGSVVALYLASPLPAVLLALLTACAMTLFAAAAPAAVEKQPDMYQPDDVYPEGDSGWRLAARTAIAGGLVGLVAAHHPPALMLVGAGPALAVRRLRVRVLVLAMVGAGVALAATWAVSGLWPEYERLRGETPLVEVSISTGVTQVDRESILETDATSLLPPSLHLLAWNLLYALAGRHVGLLPYFLPLVVLLLVWRRSERGSLLLLLAAAGLLVSLLTSPFDFAGLPAALGNRHFIPFYVMLWWLPSRSLGPRSALATVALGAVLLGFVWWSGGGASRMRPEGWSRGPILDRLPYETTQRDLPTANEVVTRDLLVRSIRGVGAGGRTGHFRLAKGADAELLIASRGALASVALEFDGAASTSIEVSGGTVGTMMLTPRGGVTFQVTPDRARVRHPAWWDAESHHFYRLGLAMPDASGETAFSISSAR